MTKRKLLLADDSITIQKVVNLTFADEGIEVIAFGNGSLAIEKLDEVHPDLVLADVHMPGLNGYEVCERVKQSTKFGKIPVMLLVGSFEPFDENEATRVGADDYLTKPFQSIKQLINKVTALLEHSSENNVETTPLPTVVEDFQFGGADVVENKEENAPATNSFDENSTFGDGLRNKFVDSGMDDKMIETNSFNWFTPKTTNVQNNFDANEKVDEAENIEKQNVSYQQVYENPPIEVNQTVPLSFSDVQEIAAESNPASAQTEWAMTEKDDDYLPKANQSYDSAFDEESFENNVDADKERNFNFEPTSTAKDSWNFDNTNDNSWKISPLKTESQQNSNDFYSSEDEKIESTEPTVIDFDATLEIKDDEKQFEHNSDDAQQNANAQNIKSSETAAKFDDWYEPRIESNQPVTENAILELDDFKQFIFDPKDDDSILDLIQESHFIKTDLPTGETDSDIASEFRSDNNENAFVDLQRIESDDFTTTEAMPEPIKAELFTQPVEKPIVLDTIQDANETAQIIDVEKHEESAPEIKDEQLEVENAQTQSSQPLTPPSFEFLAPVSQNQGLEKTNERQIAQTRDDSFANFYFTPEIIDAIAQKVVEKISDKVIEKIAWEIVPDRFDLIVKKQIEEHNRNS